MAPVRNARYIFTAVPRGTWPRSSAVYLNADPDAYYPVEGKHMRYDDSQTIDIDNEQLHGGILVKILVVSLDPYMRSKMRDASIESYVVRLWTLLRDLRLWIHSRRFPWEGRLTVTPLGWWSVPSIRILRLASTSSTPQGFVSAT